MKWKRLTSLWTDKDYEKFTSTVRKRRFHKLPPELCRYLPEDDKSSTAHEPEPKSVSVPGVEKGKVYTFNTSSTTTQIFKVPPGYAVRLRVLQCLHYNGGCSSSAYVYWATGTATQYLWYGGVWNDYDVLQGTVQYAQPNSYQSMNDMVGITNMNGEDGKPLWYISNYNNSYGACPFERVITTAPNQSYGYLYAYYARGAVKVLDIKKLEF